MSLVDTLAVKFTGDSRDLQQSAKDAEKSLFGLKKTASQLGINKSLDSSEAEQKLENLRQQMSLNEQKMLQLQKRSRELKEELSQPIEMKTEDLRAQLEAVDSQIEELGSKISAKMDAIDNKTRKALAFSLSGDIDEESAKEIAKLETELQKMTVAQDKAIEKSITLAEKVNAIESTGYKNVETDLLRVNQQMLALERNAVSTQQQAARLEQELSGASESANRTSIGLRNIGAEAKKASKASVGPISAIGTALKQAAKRVLIMSVAYKLIRSAATYLTDALKTNEQFSRSLNTIKANLAIAFQPIYEAVLPAINALMSALAKITGYIASFIAAIFGKTYDQAKAAASALNDSKNAMLGYGSAVKETKRQLAGFDQFNDISATDASAGGGGGGGIDFDNVTAPDTESFLKKIQPITDALGRLKKSWDVLWDALEPFRNVFEDIFGEVTIDSVAEKIDNVAKGILFVSFIIDSVGKLAVKTWEWIKTAASDTVTWIKTAWKDLSAWFKGKIINPIAGAFEWLINAGIIASLNGLITGLNWVIKTLNKIPGFNIGVIGTINTVSIPRMAKGGLAFDEITATVGDNFNARQNPEVISPLSDLQNMITAAVLQRDVAGGNGEITLRLELQDGTPLVDALIDPMNRTAKNRGYAPVFKVVSVAQ